MSAVVPVSSRSTDALPGHAPVVLARDVPVNGRVLPAGAIGAVIGVQGKGPDYDVRFQKPFDAVVTVSGIDLTV